MAEEEDVHGDGDDHLDGQGRVETDGPVVEDDHEVEELGEAAQHDAHKLDPGITRKLIDLVAISVSV